MKVIVTQRIQLEPSDIAQAITDYLKTNKVDAMITVAHLEEFNEDFSLDIKVDGEAPVSKAPVKRRRKVAVEKPVETVTEQESSTETSEDATVKPTVEEAQATAQSELDEAAEEKEKALEAQKAQAEAKVESVKIDDDSEVGEPEPDLMQQALDEVAAEEAAEAAELKLAEEANAENKEEAEAEKLKEEAKPLSKKSMFSKKLKKA